MTNEELAGRLEQQLVRARAELEASSQSLLSIHSALRSLIDALELIADSRGPLSVVRNPTGSSRITDNGPRITDHGSPPLPLLLLLMRKEQREWHQAGQAMPEELQQLLQALQIRALMMRPSKAGSAEEENLQEMRRLIEQALGVSRSLASRLRPPPEDEGLRAWLQWLARRMKDLYDLEVQLDVEGNLHLPDENWQAVAVQLARELLFNVARHAGINKARLRVQGDEDEVAMTIEDFGAGFNAEAALKQQKSGSLRAIRDGLARSGGALEIEAAPGRGTTITVRLPRQRDEWKREEVEMQADDVR